MKITAIFGFLILLALPSQDISAQFRSDTYSPFDRTGTILRPNTEQSSSFLGLQNFQMNHSYEMTMGSVGGSMYNQNVYTNTMHLMFNEDLYGRVDLAVAHSPFGNSFMGQENQTQFYVRNAELNYRFSENSRIQIRFQQIPAGQGYGYGYGHHRNPYNRTPFHQPYSRW